MTSRLPMSMRQECGEREEQSLRRRSDKTSEDRWDFEKREDQEAYLHTAWAFYEFGVCLKGEKKEHLDGTRAKRHTQYSPRRPNDSAYYHDQMSQTREEWRSYGVAW